MIPITPHTPPKPSALMSANSVSIRKISSPTGVSIGYFFVSSVLMSPLMTAQERERIIQVLIVAFQGGSSSSFITLSKKHLIVMAVRRHGAGGHDRRALIA